MSVTSLLETPSIVQHVASLDKHTSTLDVNFLRQICQIDLKTKSNWTDLTDSETLIQCDLSLNLTRQICQIQGRRRIEISAIFLDNVIFFFLISSIIFLLSLRCTMQSEMSLLSRRSSSGRQICQIYERISKESNSARFLPIILLFLLRRTMLPHGHIHQTYEWISPDRSFTQRFIINVSSSTNWSSLSTNRERIEPFATSCLNSVREL